MRVLIDHTAVAAALDEALAADPVRATILGSIRHSLTDAAWVALADAGLAARSATTYPVTVSGTWTSAELDELAGLLRELPELAGLSGTPEVVGPLTAALGRDTGKTMGQRLFRLDELVPPAGVTGSARIAADPDRDTVRGWVEAFMDEAGDTFRGPRHEFADDVVDRGRCWLWLDAAGTPVSMAARRDVVAGSARVGPVYTPPEARGHGYGSAITAAATRSILDDGAVPVLFTDLANPTSNKIYRLLGYRPVEDRLVTFFR